jgi:hypothetical protein
MDAGVYLLVQVPPILFVYSLQSHCEVVLIGQRN